MRNGAMCWRRELRVKIAQPLTCRREPSHTHAQSFLTIKSVDTLMIDVQVLATQYNVSFHCEWQIRAQNLLTIREAAQLEVLGDRYLVDETTAIVRFIFPCGEPVKIPLGIGQRGASPINHRARAVASGANFIGLKGTVRSSQICWRFFGSICFAAATSSSPFSVLP